MKKRGENIWENKLTTEDEYLLLVEMRRRKRTCRGHEEEEEVGERSIMKLERYSFLIAMRSVFDL